LGTAKATDLRSATPRSATLRNQKSRPEPRRHAREFGKVPARKSAIFEKK
jgi:hypothetical protein